MIKSWAMYSTTNSVNALAGHVLIGQKNPSQSHFLCSVALFIYFFGNIARALAKEKAAVRVMDWGGGVFF